MSRLNKGLRAYIIISFIFMASVNVLAEDQDGETLWTSYKLPQEKIVDLFSRFQVLAKPLLGEPYSLNHATKSGSYINDGSNNFRLLLKAFPEYTKTLDHIFEIETAMLQQSQSRTQAWSYHAFPLYRGGLAERESFTNLLDEWKIFFEEYRQNLPQSLIARNEIDSLSTLEKYEYLVGNNSFPMTKLQWMEGQKYHESYGEVPQWIGFCHGTAPATLVVARPEKAIRLKSYNQLHDITFYPSDIKKLASYAWAVTGGPTALMGNRCGSVVQPGVRPGANCLDANPGAFHLATINLLGIHKQPFIIDSSAGYEVWNRPIVSYRYSYFKPGTHRLVRNLQQALILKKDYMQDPYAIYRAPQTHQLVGVWMELTYVSGVPSNTNTSNGPEQDMLSKIAFRYDLELDDKGVIIGGEWQDVSHPDFLWVIGNNDTPRTVQDYIIGSGLLSYNGKNPLPDNVAKQASLAGLKGEVLYSIVEAMLRLSKNEVIDSSPN